MDYVYTKELVCLSRLIEEIEASDITIALEKTATNVLGDQLTISFKTEISSAEETLLDTLVSEHDGTLQVEDIILKTEIVNEPRIEYTKKYFLKADCASGQVAANATANIDLKVVNKGAESPIIPAETYAEKFLKGGSVFGQNMEYGDYVKFQIVDIDGVLVELGELDQNTFDYLKQLGGGAIIVKEYVCKHWIEPNCSTTNRIMAEAPGRIPIGLYIRCKYTAANTGNTRNIYINYDIENWD